MAGGILVHKKCHNRIIDERITNWEMYAWYDNVATFAIIASSVYFVNANFSCCLMNTAKQGGRWLEDI